MPRFTGNLEYQTVRKAKRRTLPEVPERRAHEVGILQRQVFVIEQHVDGGCDLPGGAFMDGIQHRQFAPPWRGSAVNP